MARTKASVGAKISSGKSSKARCTVAPTPSSSSSGSSERSSRNSSGGGNSVCARETPKWQRPITNFFINKSGRIDADISSEDEQSAGTSKPKPRKNVIESDNENEIDVEKPKNSELDETIVLELLDGENSHKISEYYSKNINIQKDDVNGAKDNVYGAKSDANGNTVDIKSKGKGVGKKTKINKENVSDNVERRNSLKRDLEEVTGGVEHVSKKVKVN